MKKLYTTHKYLLRQGRIKKRNIRKVENRRRTKERSSREPIQAERHNKALTKYNHKSDYWIYAPKDFRLIGNTEACLELFRSLRAKENVREFPGIGLVQVNLKHVEKIDYGTISIVNAISDDLKANNITLRGNLPNHDGCREYMIESGYLNHMYINNKRVEKSENSDLIFFEKGSGKLSEADGRKIGEMIKNVMLHLTGKRVHSQKLRTVILEICGNSIEHASTPKQQWLLGVKYQQEKVLFTVSDVGKGILETLNRKFSLQIADIFAFRSDHDVLARAFIQKYGSSTLETNRNKGLPAVKAAFDNGTILNLIAVTNNVLLNFSNEKLSRSLPKGSARLKGTFYQWEVTKECIL